MAPHVKQSFRDYEETKLALALTKGQLNSKGLFGILNSSKKRTKKINYDTSGRIVFVRFLEEFEGTKKTFRN
jgi:hypothetical protein